MNVPRMKSVELDLSWRRLLCVFGYHTRYTKVHRTVIDDHGERDGVKISVCCFCGKVDPQNLDDYRRVLECSAKG